MITINVGRGERKLYTSTHFHIYSTYFDSESVATLKTHHRVIQTSLDNVNATSYNSIAKAAAVGEDDYYVLHIGRDDNIPVA